MKANPQKTGEDVSSSTVEKTTGRKGKPISEARKEQNRISSQNYRQRRRQRLALLDKLLDVSPSDAITESRASAPPGSSEDIPADTGCVPMSGPMPGSSDVGFIPTLAPPAMVTWQSNFTPSLDTYQSESNVMTRPSPITISNLGVYSTTGDASVLSAFHPAPSWSTEWFSASPRPSNFTPPGGPISSANPVDVSPSEVSTNEAHGTRENMSQALRDLSTLSLHEKRQLIGLLELEVNVQSEPGSQPDAQPLLRPLPRAAAIRSGESLYDWDLQKSRSLQVQMEVSRYERWLRQRVFAHPHLPDPLINTLRVVQSSFYGAILANSEAISLYNKEVLKYDGLSPYSINDETGYTRSELSQARARFDTTVPRDLRPTDAQLMVPHHPYIDVIPFALFRERAVAALTADPPLFDEEEMCSDMNGEGLVCWGGVAGGNNDRIGGMAAEVPWDVRSWEPKREMVGGTEE
ncbi:hypothetical protein NM208_g2703 [Fusarium decemcellulare]|uniref:Uncharacterized protein n=1 Tax=Fusarium decemcellulare TaxID=57161 RepID=A0ACC1SRS1_9HYPO|nr:hypothetical protein NM208_g2703 [Fusarium decemcellulare]